MWSNPCPSADTEQTALQARVRSAARRARFLHRTLHRAWVHKVHLNGAATPASLLAAAEEGVALKPKTPGAAVELPARKPKFGGQQATVSSKSG